MKGNSFDHVHLQWFAEDYLSDDPEIDAGDPGEYEFVDSDNEPEEDPNEGKVVLSPEEFQSLKEKGSSDPNKVIAESFEKLGEVLNKNNQPASDMQKQPGESTDDFKKRVNERLFGDDPYSVLDEVINKKLGPILHQVGGITSQQSKDLMAVKDDTKEYFNRYKKDIEEFHGNLPQDQKANPRSWQYAYDEVMKLKQNDIISDQVERLVQEKLEQMGHMAEGSQEGGSGKASNKGVYMEGSGMSGHNVGQKKTKKVRVSPEDRLKAAQSGLDIEDYLLGIGRID